MVGCGAAAVGGTGAIVGCAGATVSGATGAAVAGTRVGTDTAVGGLAGAQAAKMTLHAPSKAMR